MALDDLNTPLGLPDGPGRGRDRRSDWRKIAGFVAIVLAAAGGYWLVAGYDGPGGRALAVAKIERAPKSPPTVAAAAKPPADSTPTGSIAKIITPRSNSADIENASGVKVVRRGGNTPGAVIISIPETPRVSLTPAPDARLVQRSRFGPLPQQGRDGTKPYEVYARPLVTSGKLKPSAPRLAILIGGMGLNAAVTRAAVTKLPADVSLAFAPYGENLDDQAARAREDGHEVFLQVPMEPFDLAGPGPGPHMLRTAYDRKQMKEHLHWHMGRLTGYVGIGNFLGAKFTADAEALAPVMEEINRRGLMYFDDGSSPRSLAGNLARSSQTPFVHADVTLDERRDARSVAAALAKLEGLTVRRGYAVGFGNALPEVVAQVARFAELLERRGIALVPVSAMIGVQRPVARSSRLKRFQAKRTRFALSNRIGSRN